MFNYYTGIGSREAPPAFLKFAREMAASLEAQGYILRSGGAPGADDAFESGLTRVANSQIYLPWHGFEGRNHAGCITPDDLDIEDLAQAEKTVRVLHPNPSALKPGSMKLLVRDVFQVLGSDLHTPSNFVMMWARPKGRDAVHGGSNMAFQVARRRDVPIINYYGVIG